MADKIDKEALEFGQRLKNFREQAGVTQLEIANSCGLTKNYISAIERGVHKCNAQTFVTYGKKCGISLDVIAGLSNETAILPELQTILSAMDSTQQRKIIDLIKLINK